MKKIEKSKYEGYIWYSDEPKPKVLNSDEFEIELIDVENPFIIEGQLFDGNVSIGLKYIDGQYIVNKFSLNDLGNIASEEQTYIANFDGVSGLQFRQYWREKEDKECNNMKVLQPAELVFVGFTKNKKEE